TGGALYGDDARRPTPEDHPARPLSPYGASKLGGEAYVRTWSASSGLPHAVCRLGNVYGPRQNPHGEAGVVAIFAHHLLSGQAPTLYGHGKPTRDYVYVGDVVGALLAALGRSGTYNIATGVETDVLTIWNGLRDAALQAGASAGSPPDIRAMSAPSVALAAATAEGFVWAALRLRSLARAPELRFRALRSPCRRRRARAPAPHCSRRARRARERRRRPRPRSRGAASTACAWRPPSRWPPCPPCPHPRPRGAPPASRCESTSAGWRRS